MALTAEERAYVSSLQVCDMNTLCMPYLPEENMAAYIEFMEQHPVILEELTGHAELEKKWLNRKKG